MKKPDNFKKSPFQSDKDPLKDGGKKTKLPPVDKNKYRPRAENDDDDDDFDEEELESLYHDDDEDYDDFDEDDEDEHNKK